MNPSYDVEDQNVLDVKVGEVYETSLTARDVNGKLCNLILLCTEVENKFYSFFALNDTSTSSRKRSWFLNSFTDFADFTTVYVKYRFRRIA